MHKSRINIYGKPNIMINSQDVCFDSTRQYAQVELKKINIFSKKKSSRQFLQEWKTIYLTRSTA
jgi:hypothetical protein